MAGLGETCSHVTADMFAVETAVKMKNDTTSTFVACSWLPPSQNQNIEYAISSDIDFTSPAAKKRKCAGESVKSVTPGKQVLPPPQDYTDFYRKLHSSGVKPVVLSVLPDYCEEFVPKTVNLDLPKPMSSLFMETHVSKSLDELTVEASTIMTNMKIDDSQISAIEQITREQSTTKSWFLYQAGRITASNFKAASQTKIENPCYSLIQRICYPDAFKFTTEATRYGRSHEWKVRKDYEMFTKPKHRDMKVTESGFFIHKEFPYIGASPDSLVKCDCCGEGLLEIKCSFSHKDSTIESAIQDKNFCIEFVDGHFRLKADHTYMYQIQCLLAVTGRSYCDLCLWTGKQLLIQRITLDTKFFAEALEKVATFYKVCILPELLGKYFSQKNTLGLPVENVEDKICYCEKSDNNKTKIYCSNDDCMIKVYHKECCGLKNMPKKGWFCLYCKTLQKRTNVQTNNK
ncbi:uncharacterized protein LOC130916556 [Corythoichthys intestinalis]|uniref:uncharacterized protein LOC130916556 n=1 Tax=Corythoichthys intestinalis TaxID=161448 RepID=UPI0025A584E4|nr:uncharacterized protein LOC130916556 [Corythoichthys intestinalis]